MSTPINTLEEEIKAFNTAMLYKLALHRNKGHWASMSIGEIILAMEKELEELKYAIAEGTREDIASESADVANFAMMIYSNAVNGPKGGVNV